MQTGGHTEQDGDRHHLFRGPAGVPCCTQYEMKGASGGCNSPLSQPCSVNKVKQVLKCFIVSEQGKQTIQRLHYSHYSLLSPFTVSSQSQVGLLSHILTLPRHETRSWNAIHGFDNNVMSSEQETCWNIMLIKSDFFFSLKQHKKIVWGHFHTWPLLQKQVRLHAGMWQLFFESIWFDRFLNCGPGNRYWVYLWTMAWHNMTQVRLVIGVLLAVLDFIVMMKELWSSEGREWSKEGNWKQVVTSLGYPSTSEDFLLKGFTHTIHNFCLTE